MIRVHLGNENSAAVRFFESIGLERDQATLNRWPAQVFLVFKEFELRPCVASLELGWVFYWKS
jgi:hypothetical protein